MRLRKLTRLSEDVSASHDKVRYASAMLEHALLHGLPLHYRIPLAILRLSSQGDALPMPHRYVIDALGRILDNTGQREQCIKAINDWNEVVLARTYRKLDISGFPLERLSVDERCVLAALMGCLLYTSPSPRDRG